MKINFTEKDIPQISEKIIKEIINRQKEIDPFMNSDQWTEKEKEIFMKYKKSLWKFNKLKSHFKFLKFKIRLL